MTTPEPEQIDREIAMTELDEVMVEKFKVLAAHRNESGKSWCDFMWFVDEHAEAFVDAMTAILPDLREQHYAECAAGIPKHIVEQVLSMGRVEWGATAEQTSTEHVASFENTLRLTREYFNLDDAPVRMHGLYLEGTETVLCHTGTSPNSGPNAQALVGAWNYLFDMCKAAERGDHITKEGE